MNPPPYRERSPPPPSYHNFAPPTYRDSRLEQILTILNEEKKNVIFEKERYLRLYRRCKTDLADFDNKIRIAERRGALTIFVIFIVFVFLFLSIIIYLSHECTFH